MSDTRRVGWRAALVLACLGGVARAENWPGFRGPTAQGVSAEKGLPTRWSATENVAWKVDLPGEGWSSPIVWDDRVFVTTVTDKGVSCRVLCVDRATGKVLWNKEAHRQAPRHKHDRNSYASGTPATDGKRVYAVFGDGVVVAMDFEGRLAWISRGVKHYSQHGLGASPLLYRDLLIMPFDGSSSGKDRTLGWQKPWDQAFLLALDVRTGKQRWRARRGLSRIAHTTPTVMRVGERDQIVSSAGDVVQGFDPEDGRRLWSVPSEGEGVVPSPVCGEGLVFTASGFGDPAIRAVRPADARGGKAAVVWTEKRSVPMIPSLVYARPYLYGVTQDGFAQCLEAATGKAVWHQRLGESYSASPLYAEGKLYLLSDSGKTTVLKTGKAFKVLARNALGERCQASAAASHGQLFIRTERRLYCIGKPHGKK
jgi:outer membrane protein assembly factor BamB